VFYSPTYDLCKIYCENCYICHEKTPVIEPRKGAKKPIISSEFRDRFQVDLIDMRTMRKKDVYGQMQHWIMSIKDHSDGLVYLAALPRRRPTMLQLSLRSTLASRDIPTSSTLVRTALFFNSILFICDFDANHLLIVFLFTFLSLDNGKEFIAKVVVEMMLAHNSNCFIVTGHQRIPQDQVQRILKSISSERCLWSLGVNWTNLLGQVMTVCTSHSGRKKYSVSSYEVVVGQRFHPQLK
jgi:hypothetical protein